MRATFPFPIATVPSRVPTLLERRERPAIVVALLLGGIVASCLSCGIVEDSGELDGLMAVLLLVWAAGLAAATFSMPTLGNFAKACSLFVTLGVVTALASAALATTAAPLADGVLDQADRLLFGAGLWPSVTSLYAAHRGALAALCYAYVSIEWQPFVLIAVLCASGRFDSLWRFLTAWGVALLICVSLFPLCPALGACGHLHIPHSAVPEIVVDSAWRYPVTLARFRSGEARGLGFDALDGIVAMPSFHACAAVILAWGFGRVRFLAVPFSILNVAMWASSVPVGGHYAVDILAGSAAALLAIGLGGAAMRRACGPGRDDRIHARPRPAADRPLRPALDSCRRHG